MALFLVGIPIEDGLNPSTRLDEYRQGNSTEEHTSARRWFFSAPLVKNRNLAEGEWNRHGYSFPASFPDNSPTLPVDQQHLTRISESSNPPERQERDAGHTGIPCPKPERFQATLRLAPGFCEIRISYLDHRYLVDRRSFGRGEPVPPYLHCDAKWHVSEFFEDREFVQIPAGRFRMGTQDKDEKHATPHWVDLDEFSIRAKPVSQAEYDLFLLQERSETPHEPRSEYDLSKPAVYLTWQDAVEFCDWITRRKNRGVTYRLPTEAGYERAMRQRGQGLRYPWGNEELDRSEDPPLRRANYRQAGVEPKVLPIGTFPPVDGLYDIAGNVWLWTSDWYEDNYYSTPAALYNPQGPPGRPFGRKVLRGRFMSRQGRISEIWPPRQG